MARASRSGRRPRERSCTACSRHTRTTRRTPCSRWTARFEHLLNVTLEGNAPVGTGQFEETVADVVRSFSKGAPATLDPTGELCRAALMEMSEGRVDAGTARWASWSHARALVTLWLARGGIGAVFDALNHVACFRLGTGSGPLREAQNDGAFSSHGFSRTPEERKRPRVPSSVTCSLLP